ncbi:hypothetical protein [Sphingomonas sp. SUN019]|uniref:hypothetical protein n=1 Tax=Sphingomonas sp. SUN019 TaxID=2937788 RepID=UPI0038D39A2E
MVNQQLTCTRWSIGWDAFSAYHHPRASTATRLSLRPRQPAARFRTFAVDRAALGHLLVVRGTTPVIPNEPRRKHMHPFDRIDCKRRKLVERAFCRIKDFRRVAARYGKLAATYAAAISLAALSAWWIYASALIMSQYIAVER